MAKQGVVFLETPADISDEFTPGVESEPDLTGYGLAADADFAIVRWFQGDPSTQYDIYFWKPGETIPTITRKCELQEMGWLLTPAVNGKIGGFREDSSGVIELYGYGYGGTWLDSPVEITPTWLRALWYPTELDTVAPNGAAVMLEAYLDGANGGWRPNGSTQDVYGANMHCNGFTKLAGGSYDTPQEYYRESNTSIYINSSTRYLAQVFTATDSYTCRKLYIRISREGSPGDLTVELQGTTGGQPDNVALASYTVPEADIPVYPTPGWMEVDLGDGVALTNGTKYAIVLKCPGADSTNRLHWAEDTTSPTYDGGEVWWSNDSGSTWNSTANDCEFEVWKKVTPGHNQICEIYRGIDTAVWKVFVTGFFVDGELTLPSDLQQVSLSGTDWITGDVSSWITPGDKMAIFIVTRTSTTQHWGLRKVGSTDTQVGTNATLALGIVELDENGQFEAYRDSDQVNFYFVGSMGAAAVGAQGNILDVLVKNVII